MKAITCSWEDKKRFLGRLILRQRVVLGVSGWQEQQMQCTGHGFNPWPRQIPHATCN